MVAPAPHSPVCWGELSSSGVSQGLALPLGDTEHVRPGLWHLGQWRSQGLS